MRIERSASGVGRVAEALLHLIGMFVARTVWIALPVAACRAWIDGLSPTQEAHAGIFIGAMFTAIVFDVSVTRRFLGTPTQRAAEETDAIINDGLRNAGDQFDPRVAPPGDGWKNPVPLVIGRGQRTAIIVGVSVCAAVLAIVIA
jgi:hypothetical protein